MLAKRGLTKLLSKSTSSRPHCWVRMSATKRGSQALRDADPQIQCTALRSAAQSGATHPVPTSHPHFASLTDKGPGAESPTPQPPKGRESRSRENADPPDDDGSGDSSSSSSSSDDGGGARDNYADDDSHDSTSTSSDDDSSRVGPSGRRRSKSEPRRRSRGRSPSRRRHKESDTCTLPEGFPTISQLPRWKAQLLACVCQRANREDERPVRDWLLKVAKPRMTFKRLESAQRSSCVWTASWARP